MRDIIPQLYRRKEEAGKLNNKCVKRAAYGKINLLLSIGGMRADGKHEVATILHKIGLYDIVSVIGTVASGISVRCDNPKVPTDRRNLCYQAAEEYFYAAGIDCGAVIEITKRIPVTGGMGGGSSDCAATLLSLNEIYGALSFEALFDIACRLGSDVPFFMYEHRAMLGRGDGTDVIPCREIKCDIYGLFVMRGEKGSTANAYARLDKKRAAFPGVDFDLTRSADKMLSALEKGKLPDILEAVENDFEICTPHFEETKAELLRLGCYKAVLCGSGPTVCGFFTEPSNAAGAQGMLDLPSFISKIN